MLQAEARHAKSTECDPGSPVETATPVPHCPTSRNNNQGWRSWKVLAELTMLSSYALGFLLDEALAPSNTEVATRTGIKYIYTHTLPLFNWLSASAHFYVFSQSWADYISTKKIKFRMAHL